MTAKRSVTILLFGALLAAATYGIFRSVEKAGESYVATGEVSSTRLRTPVVTEPTLLVGYSSTSAAAIRVAAKPWGPNEALWRARNIRELVANAERNPAGGSFSYALQAALYCYASTARHGDEQAVSEKIRRESGSDAALFARRMEAAQSVFDRCRDRTKTQWWSLIESLQNSAANESDAKFAIARLADRTLGVTTTSAPVEVQARLAEQLLLGGNIDVLLSRVAIFTPGSTIGGYVVPPLDGHVDPVVHGAFLLLECSTTGECGMPGHDAIQDCAFNGRCQANDRWAFVQEQMGLTNSQWQRTQELLLRLQGAVGSGDPAQLGIRLVSPVPLAARSLPASAR